MADVQDEEQWLYGDDKGEPLVVVKEDINKANEENSNLEVPISSIKPDPEATNEKENEIPGPVAADEVEDPDQIANEEEGEDNSSDDDDEPTVTIGKIVKQPDILRAPPPTHRAAPTSGLKDDDFNSAGKINGVPVAEFNTAELEDKPWRKPGADLSDYFNYGFNEESWIKYCERQKAMRVHESCVGLSSLGINTNKPEFGMTIIPSGPFVPENSKYGGASRVVVGAPPPEEFADDNGVSNIQVMTADRRIYSNKYMANNNPHDMDFGVPFGADFNVPPPSFYNPPPPHWVPPPGLAPPHWRQPPMGIPPPIAPPDMGSFYDGDSSKPREFRSRSRDREVDSRERDRMSPRERRHRRRSRSRSTSRPRHRRRSRSKSRSRSPSSKHKRKKSKRDRDD